MRKFNYLMIAAMFGISALVFTGCSKDNEEDTTASELKLVGTWTYVDTELGLTVEGKDAKAWLIENGATEQEATEIVSDLEGDFYDIFEDGNVFVFTDDNKYTLSWPDEDDYDGDWEFNADKTKIIFDGDEGGEGEIEFDIMSMTSKVFLMGHDYSESFDLNDDETDEEVTMLVTYKFTK